MKIRPCKYVTSFFVIRFEIAAPWIFSFRFCLDAVVGVGGSANERRSVERGEVRREDEEVGMILPFFVVAVAVAVAVVVVVIVLPKVEYDLAMVE